MCLMLDQFLWGHSSRFCDISCFFQKNDVQMTNVLRLSNSKAPSKGKHYLLTSYNVNDVTECVPREDNDNVTLMAQGDK